MKIIHYNPAQILFVVFVPLRVSAQASKQFDYCGGEEGEREGSKVCGVVSRHIIKHTGSTGMEA